MANTAPVIQHPDYEVSVGNAYLADITTNQGSRTYGQPVGVESIKSIGITKQKAEQTVYASGITYNYSSRKTGSQLAVSALQLPPDFVRKYLGKAVSTNKGFAFDQTSDDLPEFAFGYTTEYSNGDLVFKWYPRCKLIDHNPTSETATDTPNEPDKSYTILAMPLNKLIEVEYDQSQVAAGKMPLTEAAFFTDVIDKVDHTLVDSEETDT